MDCKFYPAPERVHGLFRIGVNLVDADCEGAMRGVTEG
jgi:hypothetical protein